MFDFLKSKEQFPQYISHLLSMPEHNIVFEEGKVVSLFA